MRRRAWLLAGLVALPPAARAAGAQELEPRAYSPAPIGTSFLLAGFGRSEGGIMFDPSLDKDSDASRAFVKGAQTMLQK